VHGLAELLRELLEGAGARLGLQKGEAVLVHDEAVVEVARHQQVLEVRWLPRQVGEEAWATHIRVKRKPQPTASSSG
jgi:hypothetical protein